MVNAVSSLTPLCKGINDTESEHCDERGFENKFKALPYFFKPFVSYAPFLYPLKTLENLMVF